jgi:hypothetical protein
LLQIEATHKAKIISTVEYPNTKHKEDQLVNIDKSHESSQPNMNSTVHYIPFYKVHRTLRTDVISLDHKLSQMFVYTYKKI